MNLVKSKLLFDKQNTHPKYGMCLLLSIVLFFTCFFSSIGHADVVSSNIDATLESNTISKSTSDIVFTPIVNTDYQFNITLSNSSNSKKVVKIFTSRGISKENHIEYTAQNIENLLNTDYDITKYINISSDNIDLSKTITLDAKQSKIIHLKVRVPKNFEGEMLGGVNFSEILSETGNNKVKTSQVYQKVIVVRLKGSKSNAIATQTYSDFKFVNSHDSLLLSYYNNNNSPQIIYADKGTYEVLNPKNEIIGKGKLDDKAVLTPYTKTQMKVSLNRQLTLTKGKYTFITNVDNKKTEYSFTYGKQEVQDIIDHSSSEVTINTDSDSRIIMILVLVLIVLVISLIILFYMFKKKQK